MTKQTFCRIPGPGETRACIDPWIFVYLRSNGDVHSCCRGVTIGNTSERSLAEIVDGPEAVELRSQLLSGDLAPCCVQCAVRPVTTLEEERRQVEHLVYETGFAEQEGLRRQVREHLAVRSDLLRERNALRGHADTLERLLDETRRHAANLEADRSRLEARLAEVGEELETLRRRDRRR